MHTRCGPTKVYHKVCDVPRARCTSCAIIQNIPARTSISCQPLHVSTRLSGSAGANVQDSSSTTFTPLYMEPNLEDRRIELWSEAAPVA
jgi:hypothetical protein